MLHLRLIATSYLFQNFAIIPYLYTYLLIYGKNIISSGAKWILSSRVSYEYAIQRFHSGTAQICKWPKNTLPNQRKVSLIFLYVFKINIFCM
jgi:hypothetical protein